VVVDKKMKTMTSIIVRGMDVGKERGRGCACTYRERKKEEGLRREGYKKRRKQKSECEKGRGCACTCRERERRKGLERRGTKQKRRKQPKSE
jgi:hypothetical protein